MQSVARLVRRYVHSRGAAAVGPGSRHICSDTSAASGPSPRSADERRRVLSFAHHDPDGVAEVELPQPPRSALRFYVIKMVSGSGEGGVGGGEGGAVTSLSNARMHELARAWRELGDADKMPVRDAAAAVRSRSRLRASPAAVARRSRPALPRRPRWQDLRRFLRERADYVRAHRPSARSPRTRQLRARDERCVCAQEDRFHSWWPAGA